MDCVSLDAVKQTIAIHYAISANDCCRILCDTLFRQFDAMRVFKVDDPPTETHTFICGGKFTVD